MPLDPPDRHIIHTSLGTAEFKTLAPAFEFIDKNLAYIPLNDNYTPAQQIFKNRPQP